MLVPCGDLSAGEKCIVTISYMEQLQTIKNKFWRFRFREKVIPRFWLQDFHHFDPKQPPQEYIKKVAFSRRNNPPNYPWNFSLTIYSPSPITHVDALSYNLKVKYEDNKNIAHLILSDDQKSQSTVDLLLYYRH